MDQTPPESDRMTPDIHDTGDDIDIVHADIQAHGGGYDDTTVIITLGVPGRKAAEILQAVTSAKIANAMTDQDIIQTVTDYFAEYTRRPTEIDLDPFLRRVAQMDGPNVVPPVSLTWGEPNQTGEQQ